MKKALIIVGGIVVLIVAVLLIVPALIPVETYRQQLLAQIENATGRKAQIDGEFAFSLLPRLEFTAGKVSLANAPGMEPANMVTLDKLNVRVAVFPLLKGEIVIDSFVLEKPVIALMVDRQGRPNWQFAPARPAEKAPAEKAPPEKAEPRRDGGAGLGGLRLGDVRLVDGQISYSDARTGTSYRAHDIDMRVSLPSLADPLAAEGALTWNKERITLTLNLTKPDAFLEGKVSALSAAVSSTPVKLTFKGQAATAPAVKANGALDLDVPSVRKMAAWAGQPLAAPGEGFGPLKIAGNVEVDGAKAAFREAKLSLDKIEATGEFRFDGSGRRPYVNARMNAGVVDLNPYLPPEKPAAAPGKAPAPQPQPQRGGAPAADQGWSDEPIDLTGLRQADADMELGIAGLLMRKIKIGKSQVKLALKNGRMTTELTEMALYDGNGKARITVDASGDIPAMTTALALSGVQANPVLSDAAGFDRLEGTVDADMQLSARGRSQRAMVSALDGSGKVRFADGAIRGINIGAMVRNLQSAFLDPKAREQQKTDFSELSGSFTARNGIVRNDDLKLLSPLLRVEGKGTVNLPNRTVDYRLEPKVAATAKGQGGPTDAAGIMVPVVISGPWTNLSYRPDLSGALGDLTKDPSKVKERLKELIPGGRSPAPEGGESKPQSPADTLKKLFGR